MGQKINLNIIPRGIPDVVNASQYDVGRSIQFALYDGVNPYNVSQDATVQVAGKKGDNHIFCYDQADGVVSWSGNVVTITSTQQMTAYAGEVLAQLRVIDDGDTLATVNFKMLIQPRPDAEGDISDTEIPCIISLAESQMLDAEAWAKGTKNGVPVTSSDIQYNDHAKYWADQAEAAAQSFADGIRYKGAITFATIPTSGMENGWEYNVTDAFTTDSRFSEGSGIYCEAGTNIIWSEDAGKWDIAGGLGGVQSFNGRHGNITPAANDYSYSQISGTPTLGTAAAKNVPASGDASTTEVVMGDDSRLTNARNAADVYSWAKAATKPSYDYSEINNTPTIPTAYTSAPEMDGTASAGSSTAWAKGDHIHPSDTSKADLSIIAEEFDATDVYAVDDYVTYNGGFYKCTTAHTGAWNANDFTQTLVSDEFGSGGGGSSAEYSYNIVTKSTGNYDAAITVNKYIDGVLDTSTDYLYTSLATPVTIDNLFTIGYANTRYTMTLLANSTTHTAGYSETWIYSASVDFTEAFIVETTDLSYIAPTFASSVAYAVGDLVTREGKLYKCTTAHAEGSWNPLDFTQTTVEDELATKANSSSLGTAAAKNVPASGDAATTEVVMGDDTRLTNARNAADVYSWAKAANKPTYTASEVGALSSSTNYAGSTSQGGAANKVKSALTIGTIKSIAFDGSHSGALEIWNKRFTLASTDWSATTDADGYYTLDVVPMSGSYIMLFDTDKPIQVTIAGSTDNAKPTAAQKAAYSLIDSWYYPDDPDTDGSFFRFYTKTKPTIDVYVRISGFHVYST